MNPVSPESPAPALVRSALEAEIAASQNLLAKQEGVWNALHLARSAATVEAALAAQETALTSAMEASEARQSLLAGAAEFTAWLEKVPARDRSPFVALRDEARLLRMRIEDLTRRCAWLASRSSHWIDSQRALIGELAAKSLGPGTYGSRPGAGSGSSGTASPSLLDRSA